jgi:hypothetical protein
LEQARAQLTALREQSPKPWHGVCDACADRIDGELAGRDVRARYPAISDVSEAAPTPDSLLVGAAAREIMVRHCLPMMIRISRTLTVAQTASAIGALETHLDSWAGAAGFRRSPVNVGSTRWLYVRPGNDWNRQALKDLPTRLEIGIVAGERPAVVCALVCRSWSNYAEVVDAEPLAREFDGLMNGLIGRLRQAQVASARITFARPV